MISPKWKDRDWRLNHCYWIVNKQGQKVQFKKNRIQKLIDQNQSKRKIILKSRQVGVSTNELLKQLDFVLFGKNKTALILAHEQDAIEKLFRIPRRSYDAMPDDIKPDLYKGGGSKYEMFFPRNNSRIYCDLESRGDTIHWLHISERAFIKERDRVLATIECVPMDGIITVESTPNGLNEFYEDWMDEDSNYEKLFYPWFLHQEYHITLHNISPKDLTEDELKLIKYAKSSYNQVITLDQIAFRRFKQRELKGLFKQEYPEDSASCFLTSGQNPFDLSILKPLYDKAPKPIRIHNGIRIYKEFEPKNHYIIGADTAEGVGGDFSAAHVFNIKTREQVASYHGHLKPSEFADKLVEMSDLYSNNYPIIICVERNNHGHAVLLKLDEILKYPNLFRHNEDKMGWITDKVTRPLMIDTFIEGVENGTIKLNDKDTLSECLTLTNNDGKIEAEDTKHDDLFISACIAVQMCIVESGLDIYSDIAGSIRTN